MKSLAIVAVGTDSGNEYLEFENKYGKYFDQIWENYAIWKVSHTDCLLIDSKMLGFFIDKEDLFEIMLVASTDIRQQRALQDGRDTVAKTIHLRDAQLQQRWKVSKGIDLFDPGQIKQSYDLILDNSVLSIEQELETVLSYLEEDYRFPESDLSDLKNAIPEIVSDYTMREASGILADIEKNHQLIGYDIVLQEWKHQFPREFQLLPPEMQSWLEKI